MEEYKEESKKAMQVKEEKWLEHQLKEIQTNNRNNNNKYMKCQRRINRSRQNLTKGKYIFEKVDEFRYLD